MVRLERAIDAVDAFSEWTGKAVSWLVLVLTAALGYEIVMRYVFNAPTKWVFDISYMIGGSFFLLGEAFTLQRKGQVRIDIFYSRLSARTQALIDCIFYVLLFFPLWGGLFFALIPYVHLSWITGERSMQGYWMPILYPFKTVMPIGVFMLLMQGAAEFTRSLLCVLKGGGSSVTK